MAETTEKAAAKAPKQPKIVGYRPTRDVNMVVANGHIAMRAYQPTSDEWIIEHLRRANVELEPVYEK